MGMYTTAPSGMVISSSIFVVFRQVRCVLVRYKRVAIISMHAY